MIQVRHPATASMVIKTLIAAGLASWTLLAVILWSARYWYVAQYGWEGGPSWADLFYAIPMPGALVCTLAAWAMHKHKTLAAALLAVVALVPAVALLLIWALVPAEG